MALMMGMLDYSGFPVGLFYIAARVEAKARGINLDSDTFTNNRQLFLDLGIPVRRIRTVTPHLIATPHPTETYGIEVLK